MATNPTLLTQPIAANGAKNVIPNTTTTPGAMSQDKGFPAETSLPLGAGGVAPSREDFNGAFNLLSAQNFMTQKGWVYTFDAGQAYYAGCIVRDTTDGALYECINDVAAGGSVPSADSLNWQSFTTGNGQLYLRENSTAYAIGDIAYNENLPSYMHLLCTTGGTTDSTEPDFTGAAIGGTVSDGTVVWTYSTNYDIERDYTIIYPNNGTEANPANVTNNSRYVEVNPYTGYIVYCVAEVYDSAHDVWGDSFWYDDHPSLSRAWGVRASQLSDGTIVVQTGMTGVINGTSSINGTGLNFGGVDQTSLPCRVKVFKIGKAAS